MLSADLLATGRKVGKWQQLTLRLAVDTGWWIKHGIIGGIVAAIGVMMAEMIIAALMGIDAFMPPRMIAGIVLGKSAMEPSTPLMTAALTGMMLHLVLSIVYGLILAWLVANIRAFQSTDSVIAAGTFYGLLLWSAGVVSARAARESTNS